MTFRAFATGLQVMLCCVGGHSDSYTAAPKSTPFLYSEAGTPVPSEFATKVEISKRQLRHSGRHLEGLDWQDQVNTRVPGPVRDAFLAFMNDVQEGDRISYFYDKSGLLPIPEDLLAFHYGNKLSPEWEGRAVAPASPPSPHTPHLFRPSSLRQIVVGLCLIRDGNILAAVATHTAGTESKPPAR